MRLLRVDRSSILRRLVRKREIAGITTVHGIKQSLEEALSLWLDEYPLRIAPSGSTHISIQPNAWFVSWSHAISNISNIARALVEVVPTLTKSITAR